MTTNNIEQLGKVQQNEINHKWPSALAELADVLKFELEKQGNIKDKAMQAKALAFALAQHLGGAFYLFTYWIKIESSIKRHRNLPTLCRK
ncbi:Uncharacterized conserved protein [Canicola haemoglobinophilus]|uniref:Uncharacterized conserved protein n=1 Tax=Canicola haemoglobinophilus TaxID=733 RepID=A0A377HS03_9PAST|nr:hypothetical protein [Canicola haemoglobinophilus]STO59171.1 Uncharacterized conserved protein [Canicola haemoglobinophilus]